VRPGGMAIDEENRSCMWLTRAATLWMCSMRTLQTAGRSDARKKHLLSDAGNFRCGTNVAGDKEGNVYVTDTLTSLEISMRRKIHKRFGKTAMARTLRAAKGLPL